MDSGLKLILESICDNDLVKAKKFTKSYLESNTKKCDQPIKNRLLNKIQMSGNFIELPYNIKELLIAEDVSTSFNVDRYVSNEIVENKVTDIINTYEVSDKLTEYGIKYINSLLLDGKPGCGKTMLGRYLAYRTNLPFVYVDFGRLIDSHLGETGKNLQRIFDFVRKNKCVFMIDEIDIIGGMRGNSNEVGEMSRIVISLMQCLDSIDNNTIIVAATNRIDILDSALKRRFSHSLKMDSDDVEVKKKIVSKYLDTIPNSEYNNADIEKFINENKDLSNDAIAKAVINRVIYCLVNNTKITLF